MASKSIIYIILLLFFGLGIVAVFQYWDAIEYVGMIKEQKERIDGLVREKDDIVIQKRELQEGLIQAETRTTEKEKTIEEALNNLKLRNSTIMELKKELAGTLNSVGETTVTINVVDTIRVVLKGDTIKVEDDWIRGKLYNNIFSYDFSADVYYVNTTTILGNGTRRVIEYGELRARRGNSVRPVSIESHYNIKRPDGSVMSLNPSLQLGVVVPDNKVVICMTALSYGITTEGRFVIIRLPIIGLTIEKEPYLIISPVQINMGRYLPLLHNLHITGAGMYRKGWVFTLYIGTVL